jgi:hypothetical protein
MAATQGITATEVAARQASLDDFLGRIRVGHHRRADALLEELV